MTTAIAPALTEPATAPVHLLATVTTEIQSHRDRTGEQPLILWVSPAMHRAFVWYDLPNQINGTTVCISSRLTGIACEVDPELYQEEDFGPPDRATVRSDVSGFIAGAMFHAVRTGERDMVGYLRHYRRILLMQGSFDLTAYLMSWATCRRFSSTKAM